MELLNEIFSQFNAILWGPPLILLLLGTHLWMTIRTRGVQRWVFKGIKLSVTPDKTEGDISPFAALTTALASTIGTGNIIGVATAIVSGGPGAVLWTWLTGLFGIATNAEIDRRQIPPQTEDGTYLPRDGRPEKSAIPSSAWRSRC
ncbi:MAG: alanine:cation symporter family protein [Holdemania filiformis]